MPQIGQFTRTPSGYSGQLRTLSLDLELTFVPTDNVDSDEDDNDGWVDSYDDTEELRRANVPAGGPAEAQVEDKYRLRAFVQIQKDDIQAVLPISKVLQ